LLDGPLVIRDTTTLRTALFLPNGRSSAVARSLVVKERPRSAVQLEHPTSGLWCSYLEGDFHRLPDFDKVVTARPPVRFHVDAIDLAAPEKALAGALTKEHFALRFDGYVNVPDDAVYHLTARADDGVRVEIDHETVIEDDGEHAPRDADGEIALEKGFHSLRVAYFQGAEAKALQVLIEEEHADGTTTGGRPLEVLTAP
jgi:hexosaminidase